MIYPDNKYSRMQREFYEQEAARWSLEDRDPVVGTWDLHNAWEDYELLFEGIGDTRQMIALDFGCGPGRNIEKYRDRFLNLDGTDISPKNIEHARQFVSNGCVYVSSGVSVESDYGQYDLVFSTITLQHIPVYSIRRQLFEEFYRVLTPGGWFSAQMGFGDEGDPRGVGYFEQRWYAQVTNGGCDVKVTDSKYLHESLAKVGFLDFHSVVRPTGPGDWHPNWIFFRARKP